MPEFKVGDIVECIDSLEEAGIEKGETYKVTQSFPLMLEGSDWWLGPSCFKLHCPAGELEDTYVIGEIGDEGPYESAVASESIEDDTVHSPSHYNQSGIEAIQAIEASMRPEEYQGYLKGNCLKYLWRYKYKGKPLEDLKKAQWYLNQLIRTQEAI